MRTTAMAGGLLVTLLAAAAPYGLGQQTPKPIPKGATLGPPIPSVINSTYTISDRFGAQTYVLREDGETLTLSHKEGSPSLSIEYAKVKYVPIPLPEPHPFCYIFGESNVPIATLPLRSNAEAKAVAEYIAHRAGLELVYCNS